MVLWAVVCYTWSSLRLSLTVSNTNIKALDLSHAVQCDQHHGNPAATQLGWNPWRYQFQALIPQTWFLLTPDAPFLYLDFVFVDDIP
jgi:hypothetical protein